MASASYRFARRANLLFPAKHLFVAAALCGGVRTRSRPAVMSM